MNKAIAILSGVISGGIVVGLVESVGHLIWPPPPALDLADAKALELLMESIPTAAIVMVLIAWIVGAFAGGIVAQKVNKMPGIMPSIATGLILTSFGVITMLAIPHPIWMWVFGVLTPLPAAILGAKMAGSSTPR
jgi:hypothetical protein